MSCTFVFTLLAPSALLSCGRRDRCSAVRLLGCVDHELVPADRERALRLRRTFTEMIAALASPEANPWHEVERGEISLDVYIDYIESRVPGASVLFAADSHLNVMAGLELIDDRIAAVREVAQRGLRVGLVTNNVAEWQPFWLQRLPYPDHDP